MQTTLSLSFFYFGHLKASIFLLLEGIKLININLFDNAVFFVGVKCSKILGS